MFFLYLIRPFFANEVGDSLVKMIRGGRKSKKVSWGRKKGVRGLEWLESYRLGSRKGLESSESSFSQPSPLR